MFEIIYEIKLNFMGINKFVVSLIITNFIVIEISSNWIIEDASIQANHKINISLW
jgi:hypothetical protein